MHTRFRFLLLVFGLLTVEVRAQASLRLALTQFATGLVQPVDIARAPGDGRLYVVERAGRIKLVTPAGAVLPTAFLDITSRVGSADLEQGLLGLAFHPNYAANGYFYVNYTDTNGDTHVSRFQRSATSPDEADPTSEQVLLAVAQPFQNHNGGCMKFGPDGYLYIGLGDGGYGGDPGNRAQNLNELLGKMLRIDVNTTTGTLPYGIPPTNPFINQSGARAEILGWGLRNPWRFSFDSQTGDLWIGDVGQASWEEVDVVPDSLLNSNQLNFGWRCYEGTHDYNIAGCGAASTYYPPIFEYDHFTGQSITGGFVYRGTQSPALAGRYVAVDHVSGYFWTISPLSGGGFGVQRDSLLTHGGISTFGQDNDGELYCADFYTGELFHLTATDPFGLPQPVARPQLLLTPNPATALCRVELPTAVATEVRLLSAVTGQVVRRTVADPATASALLDVRGLPAGLYLIRAEVAGRPLTRRLVVMPE